MIRESRGELRLYTGRVTALGVEGPPYYCSNPPYCRSSNDCVDVASLERSCLVHAPFKLLSGHTASLRETPAERVMFRTTNSGLCLRRIR